MASDEEDAVDQDDRLQRQGYRELLMGTAQRSQSDYDKALLALLGGGLAVSFSYLKELQGPPPVHRQLLLFFAWLCWGCGLVAALSSFWASHCALWKALGQWDSGVTDAEILGGRWARIVGPLNAAGGVLFVGGVFFLALFAYANIGG